MQFILVCDRAPKDAYCALCTAKITDSYLKELSTELFYCSVEHFYGHCQVAMLAIEHHARLT